MKNFDQLIRSGFRFVKYINGHRIIMENVFTGFCIIYDWCNDRSYALEGK